MSDSKPSLTILTEYFYPEEASTAQLMTELATNLTESFDVSVLTASPNYHDDDRRVEVPHRETHEGVDVTRLRSTRFDKDSLPLRLVNWFTFTALVLARLLMLRSRDDLIFVLSNPPVLPFVAWLKHRITGTPYVYLIYDVYPDIAVRLGVVSEGSYVARAWDRAMRYVYHDAERIVVLGKSMERVIREKMADSEAFDPEKIEVIPNWEDAEFIRPMDKTNNEFARQQGTVDDFTLVYSGNIGRFHELETAVKAIEVLEDRGRDDVRLLIIGEGARKSDLQEMVRQRGIEGVDFLPFQPLEEIPRTLTCGDASLVGIKPEMEGLCVSTKLYSSLAVGEPILAVVGEGDEVARVVRERDCGEYVPPGDTEAAADALEAWADDRDLAETQGDAARECFERRYTLSHALERYRRVFRDASRSNASAGSNRTKRQ